MNRAKPVVFTPDFAIVDARRARQQPRGGEVRHNTRRFFALVTVLALALAASACTPRVRRGGGGGGSLANRVGFNMKGIGEDSDQELVIAASSGAKWVRVDFNWPTLAPTRNTRNWSSADHLVSVANNLGLRILGQITYTPSWEGTLPVPADVGEWAGELAARYAPFGVHTWEIWNEANLKGPWPGAPDPVLYTQLLKAAYTNIHAHDSQATVVSSGLSPAPDEPSWGLRPYTFLRAMYDNGAKG